jgi:hypothetical protein|eukprot:COSAG01_NODE_303_length_19167_cov_10.792454_27_plen_164_part_00
MGHTHLPKYLLVLVMVQLGCGFLAAVQGSGAVLVAIWASLALDTTVAACGQPLSRQGGSMLARLSSARYLLCAGCTACGVSYAVRLACRTGVAWAAQPWLQLHGACTSTALLVTYALREAVATVWMLRNVDPHADGAPLGSCLARESLLHGGWRQVEPGGGLL